MTTEISKIIGDGGAAVTTFYIPWGYLVHPYYYQDGDATWSDGVTAITSSFSNIVRNTRSGAALSAITTPNGDTLDNYQIHNVEAQVYRNSIWSAVDFTYPISNGIGTAAYIIDDSSSIVVQTGSGFTSNTSSLGGGGHGAVGGGLISEPCRIRIVCSK